jgi:two-component system, chemotaxis family, sensor kinase CheA
MDFDLRALLDTFSAESDELLDSMEQGLLSIEERPGDPDVMSRIFRDAHTLKGGAASLEFTALAECAHAVEDVLESVRDGRAAMSAERLGLLLAAVDTLRALAVAALAGQDGISREHQEIVVRLRQDASGFPSDAAPAAARTRPAAPKEPEVRSAAAGAKRLRVGLDRLDRLVEVVGEIGVSRDRLRQIIEDSGDAKLAILEAHSDADRLHAELHDLTLKMRMVPIGPTFRRHARTVRSIGSSHGKLVRLQTSGDDLEIDTEVIEHLRDPLLHMIRNAVDHGIETPEARAAAGKPPCGTVALRAVNVPGGLEITVADDGQGLDTDRILACARTRGLLAADERPPDAAVHALIFESGLSTTESVSNVSGRGVGMDVVKRSIDAMRGTITIDSFPGRGCTMTVRVPLTLAVIRGFCVGSARTTYVIPVDMIAECIEWPAEAPRDPQALGVLSHRGRALPFVRLNRYFGGLEESAPRESAVVVRHGALEAALTVDALYGEHQTVVKPLGPTFASSHGVSGSTILGDGSVALLLDVPQLLHGAGAYGRG